MDAKAVLLMVLNSPSLRFGAKIYRANALSYSLGHATAWLSILIKMLAYIALIFEFTPLRHIEWRSGTGLRTGSLRYVVFQAFFSFVCKPSKYLILNLDLFPRDCHRPMTTTSCGAFRVHRKR